MAQKELNLTNDTKETTTEKKDEVVWIIQSPDRFKPAIGLIKSPDGVRLIKDYSSKAWYVRILFAPVALWRERKIYGLLDGVEGIPKYYASRSHTALTLEYIMSDSLNKKKKTDVPEFFFERLEKTVDAMHERGVVHGDLRFKNILVTEDWQPYLIDFASAISFSRRALPPWKWFCRYIQKVDKRKLVKLKAKLAPQYLTEPEKQFLKEPMFLLKTGRWLRKNLLRRLK